MVAGPFDAPAIGKGIVGAGMARDASLRGLRTFASCWRSFSRRGRTRLGPTGRSWAESKLGPALRREQSERSSMLGTSSLLASVPVAISHGVTSRASRQTQRIGGQLTHSTEMGVFFGR